MNIKGNLFYNAMFFDILDVVFEVGSGASEEEGSLGGIEKAFSCGCENLECGPLVERGFSVSLVTEAFKVDFDLKLGHKITCQYIPGSRETILEEGEITSRFFCKELCSFLPLNSMPDLSVEGMEREPFVFIYESNGIRNYFYSLFLRKKNPRAERNYTQYSLVLSSTCFNPLVLQALSSCEEDFPLSEEFVMQRLVEQINERISTETFRGWTSSQITFSNGTIDEFFERYKVLLTEEIFLCKSFLVICERPFLCSAISLRLCDLIGVELYGGDIHPYVSLLSRDTLDKVQKKNGGGRILHVVLGVTSEYSLDRGRFDNVIRIENGRVKYKSKSKNRIELSARKIPQEKIRERLLRPVLHYITCRACRRGYGDGTQPPFGEESFLSFLKKHPTELEFRCKKKKFYREFIRSPNFAKVLKRLEVNS